jgi:hypothetical protein
MLLLESPGVIGMILTSFTRPGLKLLYMACLSAELILDSDHSHRSSSEILASESDMESLISDNGDITSGL